MRVEPADGPTDRPRRRGHGDAGGSSRTTTSSPPSAASACSGSSTRSCSRCARRSGSTRCAPSEHVGGGPRHAEPRTACSARSEHYELFLNPYPDGRHAPAARDHAQPMPASPRASRPTSASATRSPSCRPSLPLTWRACCGSPRGWYPSLIASASTAHAGRMADDGYASVSYKVFNIGEANKLPAPTRASSASRSRAGATSRRSTASSRSPPSTRERGRCAHVADRAALRRAVARVRVDDARPRRR